VNRVTDETGRRALYVPNVLGDPERILRQLEFARRSGVRAVMTEPVLVGMPFFSTLVKEHLDVPVMAHPALAGASRIAPDALLGKIFRMLGADAVIFPHSGGRFAYGEETCRALADRMREAWGPLLPCMPVPAGGMQVERIGELKEFYGPEVMFLIGGSLYLAGDRLRERTEEFVRTVRRAP
jgi:ribulose-bisphosphate carboxylase large chain